MSNALLAWSTPMRFSLWLLIPFFLTCARVEAADSICIDPGLHHLRVDGQPEWEEFPDRAEATRYELKFEAKSNASEWTLQLRQQDVKQTWSVVLNEKRLGELVHGELGRTVLVKLRGWSVASNHSITEWVTLIGVSSWLEI